MHAKKVLGCRTLGARAGQKGSGMLGLSAGASMWLRAGRAQLAQLLRAHRGAAGLHGRGAGRAACTARPLPRRCAHPPVSPHESWLPAPALILGQHGAPPVAWLTTWILHFGTGQSQVPFSACCLTRLPRVTLIPEGAHSIPHMLVCAFLAPSNLLNAKCLLKTA